MTLQKKLAEKRDEQAEEFYKRSGWVPTELAVMNYQAGFSDCANLLLPEIEKLEDALFLLTVRLDESGSIHDIKPSADIVNEALQSLREFLGSDEKD